MQNESTPGARGPVFCGVDTHADSHWPYVLDWRGRKVLSRQFPADAAGYEALAGAIAAAGEPACVAMEGTSSYGAGLTRHLASLGMPVREALSPAGMQRRRPGQGKCDEADAERAARAAMSGPSTAEFKLARSSEPFDTKPLEKGRYIQLSLLDPYEIKMFGAIADGEIYLRHIPETYEKGHTLDASDFVLTSAAFEWEFDQAYPSGVVKSEARVAAEQRASAQMDECINQSSGKAKKILKYAKKSIGFSNLESKIVQAGRDFHEMIGVFGEGLYKRNDEEFSYEVIGSRLAEQRNDFAHGNIDKDFKGAAILDLLLLRYLVYAMQLKRIGVSAANTRRAINELFGLMYYLPAEDGDTETVAKNTEINEPNNETEGNADEIVEAE